MFYTQQQIVAIIHRHPHRVLLQRQRGAEAATRLVKMHFVTLKPKMMMGFKRDSLKISNY